ncbi:PREDICTED: zinc finger BED domain-containing protein 4-like [Amphimedon queenslandica]|uniref:BED-type domain-containing protein n=1 Tax=Amphimedon queenslandica TaxID=400682 RepID=A0A1X7TWE0_AMPQE|nr:PREDICTED: zinc finger BED domain-containing protein 4-like [Amphimedon queenslandica]|eukprot:XP_003389647.1 PREDICTED: zinc finger BED domain-containing protein 4-like [Amphimedon queenslandica]
MSKRRSPIWQYFTASEGDKSAICTTCGTQVSRGGKSVKSFTTTNLVNHLKKHPAEYKEYEDAKRKEQLDATSTPSKPVLKQATLEESSTKMHKWAQSDSRAVNITTKVAEMIAVDCQPMSIVDDIGFTRVLHAAEPRYTLPSRKYMTDTVIPRVYSEVHMKVAKEISEAKWVSCTSDIWSTNISNESLISLTAHWLSPISFDRKSIMLNASHIPGSHTADAIRKKCKEMLQTWGIESRLHCFVVDNAANMKKAMADGKYIHIGCFAHSIQLVIHDGIISQRYVLDILAKCRRIVGHFKHSQVASSRLKEIQSSLCLPQQRLKQDVSTRWNSTLHMLQSIIAQKVVLAAYNTESDDIPQLSSHQLDIIDKIITVLKPVDDITKSISSEKASVSIIIPYIRALRKTWEKSGDDRGVQTMKKELLDSLNRRFCDIESNETLVVATLLDPCFKDKFFTSITEKEAAKELLITKITNNSHDQDIEESIEPPNKLPRTTVMQCFDEILEESSARLSSSLCYTTIVEQYLAEPNIDYHAGNAYQWWAENKCRFPRLSELALQYLSPPPTSVASERLFSTAGDIYDEKRNRLDPERAETLLFIKNNIKLLN